MSLRFPYGFLDVRQTLPEVLRKDDRCRPLYGLDAEALAQEEKPWESLCGRMRRGLDGPGILANSATGEGEWQADFFLLRLGRSPLPPWVWSIPIPIVAMIEDLDCLWHHHRIHLPRCALAFADSEDAAALRRAGHENVVARETGWDELLRVIEGELTRRKGSALSGEIKVPLGSRDLLARCQHLLAAGPGGDISLVGDVTRLLVREPDNAELYVALGLATIAYGRMRGAVSASELGSALEEFRRALAVDPGHVLARLNVVHVLGLLGDKEAATHEARLALALLDRARDEDVLAVGAGHIPVGQVFQPDSAGLKPDGACALEGANGVRLESLTYAWEGAAMRNAGRPAAEAAAKRALIRWRLHHLLAEWTGDVTHYFEAALANPGSPSTRAALGSALARAGQVDLAVSHLQAAVQGNPRDLEAARNLYHALGQGADQFAGQMDHRTRWQGQRRLARDMWLLAKTVPALAKEAWFENAPPAGDELASIVIVGRDDVEETRATLDSVLRHTRTPFEIVLVDDGSSR